MKIKKILLTTFTLLVAILLTTGCGKETKADGTAVSIGKDSKIKANDFYKEIKEDNISKLVDMIDHKLFDKKYPTDDDETQDVNDQVSQIKSYLQQYSGKDSLTDEEFEQMLQSYYGVEDEKELKESLALQYKREQAVNDYIEKNVKDKEIETYYNENIYGKITASHILITVDVDDDATDEEKEKAEEKAKKKAEDIIKKLDSGKKFKDMAKKYSKDDATAGKGGSLGTFEYEDMEEAFSKACVELENKTYTKEPVKTSYGYHIIYKEKQAKKPKLKKVKKEIKEKIREKKLEDDSTLLYKTLDDIREEKKVTFKDSVLKKAYEDYQEKLIENASSSTTTS